LDTDLPRLAQELEVAPLGTLLVLAPKDPYLPETVSEAREAVSAEALPVGEEAGAVPAAARLAEQGEPLRLTRQCAPQQN